VTKRPSNGASTVFVPTDEALIRAPRCSPWDKRETRQIVPVTDLPACSKQSPMSVRA